MRKILAISALFTAFSLSVSASGTPAADFEAKVMYVDYRTQVHTMASLKALADRCAAMGMNTMLLEYEATFPFEKHATLKNQYAFTKEEITDYVDYCARLGLDVIPLQNCMGHAQYILKHDRYAFLRENARDFSQVCPLKIDQARPVFKEIFSEVAALHPSKYFHIGCDETFLLGSCPACRAYANEHGKSKLFVEYVKAMCELVREMGKTPIIWADIILKYPENLAELPEDLVYMDWNYGWDVNHFGNISNLLDAGVNIWGATALRSGPDDLHLTQWEKHFYNLRNFVTFARENGYKGMVQTSWSTSGAYSYNYSMKEEVLQMFPTRSVYPESGFNILLEATGWAFTHAEPFEPEAFVRNYAKEKFGFDEAGATTLWDYFTMPQEIVNARNGKDDKGRPIAQVLDDCYKMRVKMQALKPKAAREEIDHLMLMLDIRINYLEFKLCESEFESPDYTDAQREGLARRMVTVCKEGRSIDKRLWKLNKNYLKPGEIAYLQELRGNKMNTFLKILKNQDN